MFRPCPDRTEAHDGGPLQRQFMEHAAVAALERSETAVDITGQGGLMCSAVIAMDWPEGVERARWVPRTLGCQHTHD